MVGLLVVSTCCVVCLASFLSHKKYTTKHVTREIDDRLEPKSLGWKTTKKYVTLVSLSEGSEDTSFDPHK